MVGAADSLPRSIGEDEFPANTMPISSQHEDIAASLQARLEEVSFYVLRHLHERTGGDRLCLAGGVAFNSVMNGKIRLHTPFKHIFAQPAAGDAGTALGVCYYVHNILLGQPQSFVMMVSTLDLSTKMGRSRTPCAPPVCVTGAYGQSALRKQPPAPSLRARLLAGSKGVWNSAHVHSETAALSWIPAARK